MSEATATRVQDFIGDPVSDKPPVPRAKLEAIFRDLQEDMRFDHELHGCLNCGICTATCPAAHYYDFSPREIVQLLWTENLEGIYDAMQESIRTGQPYQSRLDPPPAHPSCCHPRRSLNALTPRGSA